MLAKRRVLILALILVIVVFVTLSLLHLVPLNFLSIQQKPSQPPQPVYDYYIIIDEDTGKTLMYVPLIVSVGDEVLSEDNKFYRVVKVEENRAYARFVTDINLEIYKKSADK